ncbi:MAG: hypothetical protein V1845_03645 [bacterium]
MPEQILETLFDSPVKVKLLKLFLRNPEKSFNMKDISEKTQAPFRSVSNEVDGLAGIGFLKDRRITKTKKGLPAGTYFSVSPDFDFYHELRSLVLKSSPTSKEKILKKVLRLGRIRLLLLAGIFLNSDNSRLDLFIVGDNVNHRKLSQFLKDIESEIGKELAFAVMNSKEFYYRYHMFDRFVHDILEKPHEKLVNKLRI